MKGEQRIASSLFWTVNPSVLGQLASSRSRHCRTSLTITDQKQSEEKIKKMAYYDFLTNLPNRKMTNKHLQTLLDQSHPPDYKIAVMFIDLDGFKFVNDTLGHDAGDLVLKEVSTRMANLIRQSDVLGRLGGDEFILIVENLDKEAISLLAKKLIQVTSKPYLINDKMASITASIGISIFPESGHTYESLIKKADIAMYIAKELGKNQFQFAKND